jgi:P4 family phage/plasmid primase-like protien
LNKNSDEFNSDEFLDYFADQENIDDSTIEEPPSRAEIYRRRAIKAGIIENGDKLPYYIALNRRTDSYFINCPLLARWIRVHCIFVSVQDQFSRANRIFWYEHGVYKQINDDVFQGYIKRFIVGIDDNLLKMRDVREVMQNLRTDLNFVDEDQFNADENIINFRNGILSLSDGKLRPHSPEIYSTIQIPCDYNPDNTKCPVFTKYLNELTENRKDYNLFLLQYMGVAISNIHAERAKKMLFICGKGDSGKSKILELTQRILGDENFATCNVKDLEDKFGTSVLYHKRLAGHGDMSALSVDELSMIKTLTGGDSVRGEFKGGNIFSFVYHGLLWFCTNQLPRFGGDKGEHVYNRFIILNINHVIPPERRDGMLIDKMYSERQAIVNLCIAAVRKFIANGYKFDIPEASNEAVEDYKTENSPVRQFFDECCVMRPDLYLDVEDKQTQGLIYGAFKKWYADNVGTRYLISSQTFRKELQQYLGYASQNEMEIRKSFGRFYTFMLSDSALNDYQKNF